MADYTVEDYRAAARRAADAGDTAAAKRLIEAGRKLEASQTGNLDQFGSGINEGISFGLGTPVDVATSIINGMVRRPTYDSALQPREDGGVDLRLTETGMTPGVENPVGGAGTFLDALDHLISDVPPQDTMQRYLRRGGQEIGAGAVMAPAIAAAPVIGAPARANMPAYMAANTAGDVGAAVAGQTAQEVAPGNKAADLIASLIGGAAGSSLGVPLTRAYEAAPSIDDLYASASARYRDIKKSPLRLTDEATGRLRSGVNAAVADVGADDPGLFPRTASIIDKRIAGTEVPTIGEVENTRRLIGRTVAKSPDEAFAGVTMKKAVDEFMGGVGPDDFRRAMPADPNAASPQEIVDYLAKARNEYARASRADEISFRQDVGQNRAAVSGTGGNEVNAQRQEINRILKREIDPTTSGKSRGYTPEEIAQMQRIVDGGGMENFARLVGRMAPTSGALPMMATGIGGASGATAALTGAGSPLLAVPAIAGGLGFIGKAAAESMTKREIAKLLEIIQSGGKRTPSSAREAIRRAIVGQLLPEAAGNQ